MSEARDLIIALRGGLPAQCDFCKQPTEEEKLHPEEAGEWVCEECLKRWAKEKKAATEEAI